MPLPRHSKATTAVVPKLPFFAVRFVQCICCIVVLGVLGYFQHHLWRNDYPTPWEFALLDTTSALTLFNAFVTVALLCCWGLSPVYIIVVDSFLTIFWTVSFALLLRAMGPTTTQKCNKQEWGNSAGIRVCHLFKNLVAFGLFCVVTMAGSVVFAAMIRKRNTDHQYEPALNPVNTKLANQNTSYHGKDPGTPSTMATMEPMLKRQSAMSVGESHMKHLSTMSGSSTGMTPTMQQEGWAPVQSVGPALGSHGNRPLSHVSRPSQ